MTFIIPQENRANKVGSLIAVWENNILQIAGKIDIPYHSKSAVTGNGLIVAVCLGEKPSPTHWRHRRLKIFDPNGKQLARSTEHKFTCIAAKDNVVYLGGQYKKESRELFSFIDLANPDFAHGNYVADGIVAVDLPLDRNYRGKSIDDILVRDNNLILVDNIVFPKYLFEYDISERANPRHTATKRLPNNGTYEHIYKGDINENALALFSGSTGGRGAFRHISVIKGRNINCDIIPTLTLNVETECVTDIALLGNCLAVLTKSRLCRLDLDKPLTEENLETLQANEDGRERLIKLDDSHCLLVNGDGYELKEW